MAGFAEEVWRCYIASRGFLISKIRNPRKCRVNDPFEPRFKVGTLLFASGFLTYTCQGAHQVSTPQTREGSRLLGVGSKKES
jgi:hypothetical protein